VTLSSYTYVADAVMLTEENLTTVGSTLFISRLPATYTECQRLIEEAIAQDAWADIGVITATKSMKNRLGLQERTALIVRTREEGGCFIVLINMPTKGGRTHSDEILPHDRPEGTTLAPVRA
jgi:hypothetical protein